MFSCVIVGLFLSGSLSVFTRAFMSVRAGGMTPSWGSCFGTRTQEQLRNLRGEERTEKSTRLFSGLARCNRKIDSEFSIYKVAISLFREKTARWSSCSIFTLLRLLSFVLSSQLALPSFAVLVLLFSNTFFNANVI